MQVPKQKGKRKIINILSPSESDLNNRDYQKVLQRTNNCKATSWRCSQCPIKTHMECVRKVQEYYQMEAFKKYKDDPRYRKAMGDKGIDIQRM